MSAPTAGAPKNLVNISHLTNPLSEYNELYSNAIVSTNLTVLNAAVSKMTDLQGAICTGLNQARPSITRLFKWGAVSPELSANAEELRKDVQDKLNEMLTRFSTIASLPPLVPVTTVIVPPVTITVTPPTTMTTTVRIPPVTSILTPPVVKQANDYAVGFQNLSANCWANSLLSFIVFSPSFKRAYITVAEHFAKDIFHPENMFHGQALLNALSSYDVALKQKQSVHPNVSQNVRLAFHHFFGSGTGVRQVFSNNCDAQEDASEALQMVMSRYEEILKDQNRLNPPPALYSALQTKRLYRPAGTPSAADPTKIAGYSRIEQGNTSTHTAFDYQIFLNLQDRGHLSFSALLNEFFHSATASDSEPGTYLLPDGTVQKFALTGESRQFTRIPDELMITLKRFGARADGHGFKITSPVMVPRILALPREATVARTPVAYELDAFVVHSGGFGGGHYICYKKIDGRWIEANDGQVRFVSDHEIDQILQGQKGATFTSYLHHYALIPQPLPLDVTTVISQDTHPVNAEGYAQEKRTCELAIQCLERYSAGADANAMTQALNELEAIAPQVLGTLQHAIWLEDKTPDALGYGKNTLNAYPKKAQEIQLPWLLPAQANLVAQMLAVQKTKLAIATEKYQEAKLQAFLAKLNDSAIPNHELFAELQSLPDTVQWKLHELIYASHKIKYGTARVDVPGYGKNAIEQGDIRKVLTEASEPVLNLHGNMGVEQLAAIHRIQAEKLQYAFEREQLKAFHILLNSPILHTIQLAKAFERLEIRQELKDKFYWLIWDLSGRPNVLEYGQKTFKENPRCLLLIKDPLLNHMEMNAKTVDILTQMIELLDKDSK